MLAKITAVIVLLVALNQTPPGPPPVIQTPTPVPCYHCPRPGSVDDDAAQPPAPATPPGGEE